MRYCGGLAREETHKVCNENSLGEKNTPTISMVVHHLVHLNSYLEAYIVRYIHRAEKNTINISTNSNISFCGIYGCSNLSLSSYR